MTEARFFRTESGVVMLLDVPESRLVERDTPRGPVMVETNFAFERFQEKLAKSELVPLDESQVDTIETSGAVRYVQKPRAPRDVEAPADQPPIEETAADGDVDAEKTRLLALAAERGVEVNPRWGTKRLAEVLGL